MKKSIQSKGRVTQDRTLDVARRQRIYEKAKSFEDRVAELFRFLGYTTVLDYQVDTLQFDCRLEMSGAALPIHALVECKDINKPVGQKQIRDFASKVEHARRSEVRFYQAIVVARAGFVNNAYEIARKQFVTLLTFEQLILSLVDFGPSLEAAIGGFRGTELERFYVEQDAVVQSDTQESTHSLPRRGLTETVLEWIDKPQKSFLALLGDFGAGKTSFCKRLASELATRVREKPGSARIPLIIDLRSAGSTTVTLENLLTHHFQCLSSKPLNPQALLYLNREGYLLLLFDGFDEVIAYSDPSRYLDNLRQILRAADGQAKVILTCRTHYFRNRPEEIRHLSNTSEVLATRGATRLYEELTMRTGVDIAYLQEFTEHQIDSYLIKAVPPPGDWQELRNEIRRTYNLHNLAERPFLLEMIVKTLPKLRDGDLPSRITVGDLYATYCESWFSHTDSYLTMARERKVALVEHLARKMWDAPEKRVYYQDLFEECTSFFSDQPLAPHEKEKIDFEVRTALFLHRDADGFYSFIHRSFLEFFVARSLRIGLAASDPACLDGRRLTREVVFFLTFWPEAEEIPALASRVLAGRYVPRISENALQLLVFLAQSRVRSSSGSGLEFLESADSLRDARKNFRRWRPSTIHLEGADLEGYDLRGADLEGADLSGSCLNEAQMQGASLARARLQGASLTFANAWGVSFEGATLTQARLEHAQCREADFRCADLTGADLSFAHISAGHLETAGTKAIEALEEGQLTQLYKSHREGLTVPQLCRQATFLFVDSKPELKISRTAPPQGLVSPSQTEPARLSFSQSRIYFLSRLDPEMCRTVVLPLELRGPLSVCGFARSLTTIVQRHEILRTIIRDDGEYPVQEISTAPVPGARLVDMRALSLERCEPAALSLIESERSLQPKLKDGPLFRWFLIILKEDWHIAVLAMDLVVGDRHSWKLLLRELGILYGSFFRGLPVPLEPLPAQFASFAEWQRRRQSAQWMTELTYWKRKLEGAPPFLEFPTDRPRPAVSSRYASRCELRLAGDLAAKLHELASRLRATLYMTLLAAFKILLASTTGGEDILVGLPVNGRHYEAFEQLIGLFSDLRVLRADLSGDPVLEQVLERVREASLAAYAAEITFYYLVEELAPKRSLSHSPLVQVTMAFEKVQLYGEVCGLVMRPVDIEEKFVDFDLSLTVSESAAGLAAVMVYRPDLFDRTTILRTLRHFDSLLTEMTVSPDTRIGALTLLAPGERQQAVVEWNDSKCGFERMGFCVQELFEEQARRTPEAISLVFEEQTLTYRDLDLLAEGWASRLRELGVGPECRVALFVERSIEMVVGLFAILKAGGTVVPIEPAYPRMRTEFILQDASVSVIITQKRLLELLPKARVPVIIIDDQKRASRKREASANTIKCLDDNLCYVIYTSGSTGVPKGVMITHRAVVNRVLGKQLLHGLAADDRVLQLSPLIFDVSLIEIFWPLLHGSCVVLAGSEWSADLTYLASLIKEQRITTLEITPVVMHLFLSEPGVESYCSSLRRVVVGGDLLSETVQREFHHRLGALGVELHSAYGPTEATIEASTGRLTNEKNAAVIGRPVPNVAIYILDQQLRPVPIGGVGEMYIGGVQVARGYNQRAGLTAERFRPDCYSEDGGARFYATGDLARYGPEGLLTYVGRADLGVKVRGFRVELQEIEVAISRYPGVSGVVVVAREDAPRERRLVAYLVKTDVQIDAEELRSFLQSSLPRHMVPERIEFIPAMPMTASGKVDRRALPVPVMDESERRNSYVAPRDSVERGLAEIWRDILRVERVGRSDNFFETGGHSLNSVQVIARINEMFRVELPLIVIFKAPTLEELAKVVKRARSIGVS